jgi:hypothetical protein
MVDDMNEQIKEFARQSGFKVNWQHEDVQAIKMAQLTEFAELIIRKCAKVADLADENKCEWIGGNILNHFGVRE